MLRAMVMSVGSSASRSVSRWTAMLYSLGFQLSHHHCPSGIQFRLLGKYIFIYNPVQDFELYESKLGTEGACIGPFDSHIPTFLLEFYGQLLLPHHPCFGHGTLIQ